MKFCRLLELSKRISLDFRFCCYGNRQLFWFWLPQQRNFKSSKILLLSSNSLQNCNPIEQKTLEILHFHFFIICWIASETSSYAKMRLKIYKMATSILLTFLTLGWDISRAICRIDVIDGSFFGIFHALPFELKLFFDRIFPLRRDNLGDNLGADLNNLRFWYQGDPLRMLISKWM